uniref:Mediator of RNA polymerase II transcription subunit 4 n=1 Tax=Araucaria cunninghamii TaxID=56994 RepID=A0A0D6R1K8_ARACU
MQNAAAAIIPSPARLGLPVPEDSLAMPTGPPPSAQKISERDTPLYALPPKRRAHLLLQEMAGLTSRLFEVSSNKASWLTAYRGSIPTFLQGSSIPPEGAKATTPKEILSILESHQALLEEAVMELQEIEKIEEEKQRIAHDIASKDSAMRAFARKLRDAQQVLDQTLEDYSSYRKGKRSKTSNSNVDDLVGLGELKVSEIVSYAHRISYTTYAPPEFASGQAPLRGAIPPAPQEEQMRASQLYQFADLDVGISKQTITEPLPVALVEPPAELAKENPLLLADVIPGVPVPAMPPGWRPGMPIELPPMPPGWKPGDPIPSPPPGWKPGDAVVIPKPQEQVQPPQKPVAPARPPAEAIQVPFVQLDINPDDMQDEYSSEYSTEEGSSEEEDED